MFTERLKGALDALGVRATRDPVDGEYVVPCPTCNFVVLITQAQATNAQKILGDIPHTVACERCGWTATGLPGEVAKAFVDAQGGAEKADDDGATCWDIDDILAYQPDPKDEIWEGGIMSRGEPMAIVGAPGVGKSRLALQAAICTILGYPFLKWKTNGVGLRWLFLQTENNARRLHHDLTKMLSVFPDKDLQERLRGQLAILKIDAMEFQRICMTDGHADRIWIDKLMNKYQPDIVVVDPLRDTTTGDLNKDSDMSAACSGITSVIRKGCPARVPFIVHHGRTGAAESAKVFGDDASSFGRNSKVLHGWLRSQINVSAAGVDHPEHVIFGCGKHSNGPRWEPFAARLDVDSMLYVVDDEFDLSSWGVGAKKEKSPSLGVGEVYQTLADAGGSLTGGKSNAGSLFSVLVKKGYGEKSVRDAIRLAILSNKIKESGYGKTVIYSVVE
jgi:hypothetical protein